MMISARALFVYSGFWVAVCGFGLAFTTYVVAGIEPDFVYCSFCFCSAYFTYSVDRMLTEFSPEDRLNRPGQWEWQVSHGRFLRVVLALAGLASVVLLFFIQRALYLPLALFACLAILYLSPRPQAGMGARVRGILKPFLLTAVWIGGVVWIPLLSADRNPMESYLPVVRFALFAGNCVLFDVLDYRGDRRHDKLTFAVQFGRPNALRLALGCLLVCMALVVAWVVHTGAPARLRELVPPLIFLWIACRPSLLMGRNAKSPYTRALLDGLLLLPLPLHGVYLVAIRLLG